MEYLRELTQLWNWLPAFRAIAEAEGLHGAGKALWLSPSALSRSLKQLETQLGVTLFDRVGRRLVLNERGRALLVTVRTAMRQLHDGTRAVTDRTWHGAFRVWAPADVAELVALPALQLMMRRHPNLEPTLDSAPADLAAQLSAGTLDFVLTGEPVEGAGLVSERLAPVALGVHVSRTHPLLRKRRLTLEDLSDSAFVASVAPAHTQQGDRWPADVRRTVTVRVSSLHTAFALCRQSQLLVVAPDALAAAAGLRRLATPRFSAPLVAIHRGALGVDRARPFLDAIRSGQSRRSPTA